MLLFSAIFLSIYIPKVVSQAQNEWTIDGDMVYIDDENVRIEATPHTIASSQWVYFNVTTKSYTGDIDVVVGFNTTNTKPTKAEYENYHLVEWNTTDTRTYYYVTDNGASNTDCDVGHDYNTLHRNVSHKIWNGTNNETNTTIWSDMNEILCFDNYETDGENYTITWHTEHNRTDRWVDVSDTFSSLDYDYGGMNKWYYVKNIPIEAGISELMRVFVKVPIKRTSGKYWFAVKPSSETLSEAIANGHLYYLDPWWNSSWDYRKEINITENSGSNLENYAILLNITYDNNMSSDFSDLRFTDSADNELDYWIKSKSDNTYADVYVELNNVTNSTTETFYMYYGNAGASSQSSSDDTVIFWDDFEDNDVSDWTEETSTGMWDTSSTQSIGSYSLYFDITGGSNTYIYKSLNKFGYNPGYLSYYVYYDLSDDNDGSGIELLNVSGGESHNSAYYWADWQHGGGIYEDLRRAATVDFSDVSYSVTDDYWYLSEIYTNFSDNTFEWYINDSLEVDDSGVSYPVNSEELMVWLATTDDQDTFFDDILMTQMVFPEPTYSIGAEESVPFTSVNVGPVANCGRDLQCNVTVTDAANATVQVEWFWYNGTDLYSSGNTSGVSEDTETTVATVSSSDTSIGETWNCTARAYDGVVWGSYDSDTVDIYEYTISNYTLTELFDTTDNDPEMHSIERIDSTHFLVSYQYDISGDDDSYIGVLEVNTTDYSIIEHTPITETQLDYGAIAKIDDTHYLVSYRDDGDADAQAGVWEVNQTDWSVSDMAGDIKLGEVAILNAIEKINDTHYITTYGGADNDGFAAVIEVNTSDYSLTGYDEYEYDTTEGYYSDIAIIDDTHYLVSNTNGAVVLEADSSNNYTLSNYSVLTDTAVTTYGTSLSKIDSTHFVEAYPGTDDDGYVVVIEVNTTDWSLSSYSALEYDTTQGKWPSIQNLSSDNRFLVTYTGAGDDGYSVVLKVDTSDYSISIDSTPYRFLASNFLDYNELARINDTLYINAFTHYYRPAATNHFTASAMVLELDESLCTTTGASDTCTPPSINNDWEVNAVDNCTKISSDGEIDLGTGKIILNGTSGYLKIDGTNVTCSGLIKEPGSFVYIDPSDSQLRILT